MSNDYNKIIIYHEAIFKNEWLKKPVIEKLYEMMNRANNNEKRKRKILKALQRLIQTQSSTEKQENHQKT
ncbi:hypothetical protein [Vulcanisaeta distributa]|uniref:hypothetical protein n=1 Tax=Vulcanisaeta distributa TaxID=164451 RepID=UPI0006D2499D|nr:hypothetical protein [Vulcanisaeta distributa]